MMPTNCSYCERYKKEALSQQHVGWYTTSQSCHVPVKHHTCLQDAFMFYLEAKHSIVVQDVQYIYHHEKKNASI